MGGAPLGCVWAVGLYTETYDTCEQMVVGIPIPFVYYNSNMSFLPLLTKCGSINSLMEKLFSNLHIILSINGHKFKDKILIIIITLTIVKHWLENVKGWGG